MIEARRAQLGFAEGLISEEVSDLWDDWMRAADQVLDDDQLLTTVYEALAKRRPNSRTRGRLGTPGDIPGSHNTNPQPNKTQKSP